MLAGSLAGRGALGCALGATLLLLGAPAAHALDMNVTYDLTAAQADADVYDGAGGFALSLGGHDFVQHPDEGLRFGWQGGSVNKWVLDGMVVTVATAGSDLADQVAFDVTMYFDPMSQEDLEASLVVGMRELYECAYTDGGAPGSGQCQAAGNLHVVDTLLWEYFQLDADYVDAELTGVAGSQAEGVRIALADAPTEGVQVALSSTPDDGEYAFQIGGGASGRNVDNGAAMWFHYAVLEDPNNQFTPDFEDWLASLNVNYTSSDEIPEPASLGLLAVGMLGMSCLRRRRRVRA